MKVHQNPILPSMDQCFSPFRLYLVLFLYTLFVGGVQYIIFARIETFSTQTPWYFRLSSILFCYLLILAPLLVLRHVAEAYIASLGNQTGKLVEPCRQFMTKCFTGHSSDDLPLHGTIGDPPNTRLAALREKAAVLRREHKWLTLTGCLVGLNVVYVLWGVLQERLMTKDYGGHRFAESQFLVFSNRVGALIIASICILIGRRFNGAIQRCSNHLVISEAPLSGYAYPALSNILSSWCQYEALLFITFPVQVISKSCKIIPVMLAGKILYGRSYQTYEYVTAGLVSLGVCAFILSAPPEQTEGASFNSLSGLALICGYIALDSYTSTFQDNLFKCYNISSLEMMLAVSGWATVFTFMPLVSDGTMQSALRFARGHPQFILDASGSAICSGFGQILIYATIAEFGAVTFVIIMTVRQSLSILVSCLLFGHPVNVIGALGIVITFGSIFSRVYIKRRQSGGKL